MARFEFKMYQSLWRRLETAAHVGASSARETADRGLWVNKTRVRVL